METKKTLVIILSAIAVAIAGVMLYLTLGQSDKPTDTPTATADSIVVAKNTAAIDTTKDLRIIRSFYQESYGTKEIINWDSLQRQYLTPNLANSPVLFPAEGEVDPFIQTIESSHFLLKTLRVWALKGGWYMVAYKDTGDNSWTKIALRMVTDKDGRRKIGYVAPTWEGQTPTDDMFYPAVIPMPSHEKSAEDFVRDLYKSYLSTCLSIAPNAFDARQELIRQYIDKALVSEIEHLLVLDPDYIAGLVYTATPEGKMHPQYEFYRTEKPGWFAVRAKYDQNAPPYYVQVEKKGSRYVMAKLTHESPMDEEGNYILTAERVNTPAFYVEGNEGLSEYFATEAQYPSGERELGLSTKVDVAFVVEADGTTSNYEMVCGTTDGFEAETLRLLKGMDTWVPGRDGGSSYRTWVRGIVAFTADGKGHTSVKFVRTN